MLVPFIARKQVVIADTGTFAIQNSDSDSPVSYARFWRARDEPDGVGAFSVSVPRAGRAARIRDAFEGRGPRPPNAGPLEINELHAARHLACWLLRVRGARQSAAGGSTVMS